MTELIEFRGGYVGLDMIANHFQRRGGGASGACLNLFRYQSALLLIPFNS